MGGLITKPARAWAAADNNDSERQQQAVGSHPPPVVAFMDQLGNQKFVNRRWLFGVEPPNKPPLVPVTPLSQCEVVTGLCLRCI